MQLIAELRRRNVIRMAGLYLVGAWLAVQVAGTLLPVFAAPAWVMRALVIVLAFGFVATLIVSWLYELTPEGLRRDAEVPAGQSIGRDTARRIDRSIIAVLLLALGYFAFDKFVLGARREAERAAAEPLAKAEPVAARSIAVLPFADMSPEQDQEYFSDGISEELLNRLSQFQDLRVAARTSAFQFKGKNLDVAEIGRKLKVANVLEGSVRKSGTRLRITAQLINAETGFHQWSETFERDATDVFRVQDEIANAIAGALQAKLSGRAQAPRSANPAAYDEYLKGRDHFARRQGDNLKLAVADFDRAIALDPAFSPAHSGRAFAFAISGSWEPWMSDEESLALADRSAAEALRLDAGNAEAYVARGIVRHVRLQIAQAREDFDRALALAPDNVDVLNFYGDFLERIADLRQAERMKRKCMALDPLAFVHPMNLSNILADQGRFEEALPHAERVVELGLDDARARITIFALTLRLGRLEQARAQLTGNCDGKGPSLECGFGNVVMLATEGRKQEAAEALERMLAQMQKSGPLPAELWANFADIYANVLGDIPKATAAMRESLRKINWSITAPLENGLREARLPEEISTDPEWLAIWDDPMLAELVATYRANLVAFRAGG